MKIVLCWGGGRCIFEVKGSHLLRTSPHVVWLMSRLLLIWSGQMFDTIPQVAETQLDYIMINIVEPVLNNRHWKKPGYVA